MKSLHPSLAICPQYCVEVSELCSDSMEHCDR